MEITKQEFEAYLRVQKGGRTNMFDVQNVEDLSGLPREKIIAIMKQYNELKEKYMEEI